MPESGGNTRIAFPLTLTRDMRRVKTTLYDPDNGLIAEMKQLRRKQDATFWVALSTFATMVAGVGSLIISLFHVHL